MKTQNIIRTLTIASIVAIICVYAVMGISGFTLATSFSESLSGLTQSFEGDDSELLQMTVNLDGSVIITMSITVRNPGMMDITATLNIKLLSSEGEVIAESSDSRTVQPGSSSRFEADLYVSPEDALEFETSPPVVQLNLEIKTLSDLVGMSFSVEIGEGEPTL